MTLEPQLNIKISIDWSSRYQHPNSNSIMNSWFLVRDTLNFQKYQNIKNIYRKVTDFFCHIEGRMSPAEKITLRGRALRVIAFGLHPKIREVYPSRRFLHTQNSDPGKFFPMHQAASLIYSWCRVIISIIFNSGSLPTQFWAQIQILRLFFILNNVSGSIQNEFYMMSKFLSKWRSHHRPLFHGLTIKSP